MNTPIPAISAASRARITDLDSVHVDHFIALARQGQQAGGCASTGEAAALTLRQQLGETAWLLGCLDDGARAGFLALLVASADPDAAGSASLKLRQP